MKNEKTKNERLTDAVSSFIIHHSSFSL